MYDIILKRDKPGLRFGDGGGCEGDVLTPPEEKKKIRGSAGMSGM
jgi:hypothetical protein